MNPPHICELSWNCSSNSRFEAQATEEFWNWWHRFRNDLYSLGVRVKPSDAHGKRLWFVLWKPEDCRVDDMNATIMSIRELALEADIKASEFRERDRREKEERDRKWREEREARRRADAEARRQFAERQLERCRELQSRGRALFEKYGQFTHRKRRLQQLCDIERMLPIEYEELARIIKHTETKAAAMAARVGTVKDAVVWSDDVVEQAIRVLTEDDDDEATVRNGIGWSSADSSSGHWCYAELNGNRAAALDVARGIVGKYTRQLVEVGVLEDA